MTQKLPKFKNPPVIETVLGVEFKPLLGWQLPHFGLYWNRIRSNYQQFSVQPPLPETVEKFGPERNTITISLSPQSSARCWFFDKNNTWLLQIQNSRFLSNWKKSGTSYPRYKAFYERFDREWKRFNEFLESEHLGEPELLQTEVSYINHLEVDTSFDKLSKIFPVWAGFKKKKEFLPSLEAVTFNTIFVIPENRGRLYITMQPVVRHADIKSVLQLSVTAKVRIASNREWGTAIALAHEWVVRGFTDFTSEEMHRIWERYNNTGDS